MGTPNRKTPKFLRFRTTLKEAGVAGPLGVFRVAGLMGDSDDFDPDSGRRLEEICGWFNTHLPVPYLDSEH
jgi:hypothetical protein